MNTLLIIFNYFIFICYLSTYKAQLSTLKYNMIHYKINTQNILNHSNIFPLIDKRAFA